MSALQAMSIATGFIYTILICIACIALWRALKVIDINKEQYSYSLQGVPEKISINMLTYLQKEHFEYITSKGLYIGAAFDMINFVFHHSTMNKEIK